MAVRIAVDVMGPIDGPLCVVSAALQVLSRDETVELVLVGDENRITEALAQAGGGETPERLEIFATSPRTQTDPPAAEAAPYADGESVMALAKLGAGREVSAVVCTGEVGTAIAACELKMKPLPCIARIGLAAVLPWREGSFVLCDAGASVQAEPSDLLGFGVLGGLYAQKTLNVSLPKVALLATGSGGELDAGRLEEAGESLLQQDQFDFVGTVGFKDVFRQQVDVVVCDGFTGRLFAGVMRGLAAAESGEIQPPMPRGSLDAWPLLGLDVVAVICAECEDEQTVVSAIAVAKKLVDESFSDAITAHYETPPAEAPVTQVEAPSQQFPTPVAQD